MLNISKKILTDEAMHPLAVQLDYQDWLVIERLLSTIDTQLKPSAVERAQQQVRRYVPIGRRSLVDELIAERRHEAEHE